CFALSPFAAWLSSLTIGDSERKSSAAQQREPMVDIHAESAATGLVQRCVVVQKDQLGFGFTVCGERVKLVQNVRPGGAAVKAGVHEGDRIIKVNGSLVSSMSHQEVVKLIKSGPYAALTLQGPPPFAASLPLDPLPADLPPNKRTSLGGEAPPPPPPPLPSGLSSTPSQRITGPKPLQDPEVQKHATQILRKMLEQEEAELQELREEQSRNPSPSLGERIESAQRRARQVRVKIQQDLSEETDPNPWYVHAAFTRARERERARDGGRSACSRCGSRWLQLFYLSVEAYLGSSPKDARALAPQICSHFLDTDAPLKIRVREEYLSDIEGRLHAQEDIRGPLSELQQQVLPDVQEQIQDYRNKQTMGLGSLFGEGDLLQLDGDPVKERQVVDRQVTALWEILSKHEEDRSSPLASAVHLYLRHSGIKLRDSKVFPGLSSEKEKWLAFLKTKKPSGTKKEKDGEDKKRNPILKYIGKPRTTSQSSKYTHTHTHTHTRAVLHLMPSLSLKLRSLENPTPPYTPRSRRRSVDSPLALLPDATAAALEEELSDGQNWQDTVPPQLLATLSPGEVDRQAVIYELLTTEASHLRTLRVLDQVFFQKMRSVLNSEELACVFPNLPQVYDLHASLCEAMKKRRETAIVQDIGDVMLARVSGSSSCNVKAVSVKSVCSAASSDLPALQRAQACCRGILQAVNEVVRETEHRQRLSQYQRRLDAAPHFKSLDLSTKRMIHEGPLTWKVSKDKQIEIQALLLSDCLLLLQRGPDDRLQLRYPSRWLGGSGGGSVDSKNSFSPLVKLDALLVRPVATDNKALYVISTTERQIYELVAGTSSERNTWKNLLERTISSPGGSSPLINHGPTPICSPSLRSASPVSTGSNAYADNSITEQSDSTDTHSSGDDIALSATADTDQSEGFVGVERKAEGVAESALQDGEEEPRTPASQSRADVMQLILRDLEEGDAWSHNSGDTPTNETASERSSRRPESLETVLHFSADEWEAEPDAEAPPPDGEPPGSVQVVRKAVVAGPSSSSSVPDDITADQSSKPRGEAATQGNTFYLVMPTEPGESATDDLSGPRVPPPPPEDGTSPRTQPEEETPAPEEEPGQSGAVRREGDEEAGPSQAGPQSHVIRNVDEIFHTIEGLMSKLRQLREIEKSHQKLLKTLREPFADEEPEDQPRCPATVSRTPSLDRGSADGKAGGPAEPRVQSTGF
uniref:rho guanine nucleotide exchange factor 11 n=1 Tax=Gasterosteus aculeatus aculeatus TaxID=481459 RepID=UPI001A9925A8